MKRFLFFLIFLMMTTSAYSGSLNMYSQKGEITKSPDKNDIGKKVVFFNLNSDKPEIYKETINMRSSYIKSNDDEECIILLDGPILQARYVNYIIINKHKMTFMYIESQIDLMTLDFINTIAYGKLTD